MAWSRIPVSQTTYDRHTGVQSALETESPDKPLLVAHPVKPPVVCSSTASLISRLVLREISGTSFVLHVP